MYEVQSLDVATRGICSPSYDFAFSFKGDVSFSDMRQNSCVLDRVVE